MARDVIDHATLFLRALDGSRGWVDGLREYDCAAAENASLHPIEEARGDILGGVRRDREGEGRRGWSFCRQTKNQSASSPNEAVALTKNVGVEAVVHVEDDGVEGLAEQSSNACGRSVFTSGVQYVSQAAREGVRGKGGGLRVSAKDDAATVSLGFIFPVVHPFSSYHGWLTSKSLVVETPEARITIVR